MRRRALSVNALVSALASAAVFLIALLQAAILARGLTQSDYRIYSIALSLLPFLLLPIQSLRTCAGSALTIMRRTCDRSLVKKMFAEFLIKFTSASSVIALAVISVYLLLADPGSDDLTRLTFGLASVFLHTVGVSAAVYITGIGTALEDFTPENILKAMPPLLFLLCTLYIFHVDLYDNYYSIFISFALSPWLVTLVLFLRYFSAIDEVELWLPDDKPEMPLTGGAVGVGFLLSATTPVIWWNITAYFSTTVTVAIVATVANDELVPFSMAFLLIGILSGGLIAISSPIVSNLAQISNSQKFFRLEKFWRLNYYFYLYIITTSFALAIAPSFIFELWVGAEYGPRVQIYTQMLVPAFAIRLLTMCFTLFVLSTGRQALLWFSPTCEAIVATVASLVLAIQFGIVGVAAGLTLSALVRLALTIMLDIKRHSLVLPINSTDILFPFYNYRKHYKNNKAKKSS